MSSNLTSSILTGSIDQCSSGCTPDGSHVESSPLSSVSFNLSSDNLVYRGSSRRQHQQYSNSNSKQHRDSDATSSSFGNSNSLHSYAGIDFLQLTLQHKLDNTLFDPFTQTALHNELYEIIELTNQNIFNQQFTKTTRTSNSTSTSTSNSATATTTSTKKCKTPPNCHKIKNNNYFIIQDYSLIVLSNNHFLWNIKNLGSFMSSSPLFQSNEYHDNINHFRDDLHLIHRFYKVLVNDFIFQLCFVPETNATIKPATSRRPFNQISLFQFSKLSISNTIKTITELKLQFEHLENQYNHQQQQQQQTPSLSSPSSASRNNSICNIRLIDRFLQLLSNTLFLNHYNPTEYLNLSILQRFIYNALSNFTSRIRLKMIEDQLFQNLFNLERREILFIWMIFCSNNSQQYYLNTCNPSAFNLSFISKSPFLPSLLVVLKEILRKIEVYKGIGNKKHIKAYYALIDKSVPSIYDYMEQKIKKVTKLYNSIYQEAIEASQHSDIRFNQIIKLVSNWNLAMQSFSAIFSPTAPKILTKKPIASDWHLSAYLMSFYCGLTFFIPNQPKLLDRVSGTPPYFFESIMFINYEFCFPKLSRYYRSIYDDYAEKFRKMSDDDKSDSLLRLWDDCFVIGGVLFCTSEKILAVSVGHLNYLFSIKMKDNQKYFLVGDPEIKNFKIFTLSEMSNIVLGDVFYFSGPKAE
ncbi:hypothetical protein PPL_11106 [Heterostelium album PN500]|uniref:Uncharacterized protein n=1 Tax=Heterostelium pallidum (strain ATCC 26659 / Pp 5 / PN500) TaxID=670386 RepID=D3BSY6_HETP5|nr:hypothetical protein PPL_11106 [Heterostelium album PN500]EFA75601.1 hypothetical protein PPL_11106 [Heterostelium album PN500]|eukprot:XP_020427735.1 hypothetical protein PPL_11106 [Heterostelium album PN500]